jgi:hypothetical protein
VHKVKDYDAGDGEHACNDGGDVADGTIHLLIFEFDVLVFQTIVGVTGSREGAIMLLYEVET